MGSVIDFATLFADLAALLVLAAAVMSRSSSPLARLRIAMGAFAVEWPVDAAFATTRPPSWMLWMGAVGIVLSVVVVLTTLHLWTQAGASDEGQSEPRDDEGGGGRRRPGPDAPEPAGGGDPSWWPEFERRLASWVAAAEADQRARVVGMPQDLVEAAPGDDLPVRANQCWSRRPLDSRGTPVTATPAALGRPGP